MTNKNSKLDKIMYCVKYTGGSYLDALSSMPIWTSEKIAQASHKVFGERNPRFLSEDYIHENSPVYKGRRKLRDNLDTKPGALFLQSNIIGAIPFVIAGMPAAEFTQQEIEKYLSEAPKIVQYTSASLATLLSQMVVGYTVFMANEVRVNKQKYVNENGKLSARKIGNGLKNAIKAFLTFDLSYIGAKTGGQSLLLAQGKDPWKASGMFDALAIPAWYALGIGISLKSGVIETKETKKWKAK
jgi:hypothetical protein